MTVIETTHAQDGIDYSIIEEGNILVSLNVLHWINFSRIKSETKLMQGDIKHTGVTKS